MSHNMDLENIIMKDLENSLVYKVDGYDYFVFPYKGISSIMPDRLNIISDLVVKLLPNFNSWNTIVTTMVDGIIVSLPIAIKLDKNLMIARDHHYNVCNFKFLQTPRYFSRYLYLNIQSDDNDIVLIEPIISSGATAINLIKELEYSVKANVVGVYALVNKPSYGGKDKIIDMGVNCRTVFDVVIHDGRVKCNCTY